MIYLVNTKSSYNYNNIIQRYIDDQFEIEKIMLNEDNINEMQILVKTPSIIADQKAVIVENLDLFKKKYSLEFFEMMQEILQSPIAAHIFFYNNEESGSLLKLVKNYAQIIDDQVDQAEIIDKVINDLQCQITKQNKTLLFKNLNYDNDLIINEIKKLNLASNIIDEKLIENFSYQVGEENIFLLMQYIMNNEVQDALNHYEKLINSGYETITIINVLYSQFMLFLRIRFLENEAYSISQIAKFLKRYENQIIESSKLISHEKTSKLIVRIEHINDLELKVKQGKISGDLAIKLIILG